MVVNRPEIILYTCRPDEDYLKEICAGIEEEGIPERAGPELPYLLELERRKGRDG